MTLPDWLGYWASTAPERVALRFRDEAWTFSQLDEDVSRVAAALLSCEVRPGDRVALLLSNGPEYVRLVHVMMRIGAVLVPLNRRLTQDELTWQVEDAGASLLVYDEAHAEQIASFQRAVRVEELYGAGVTPHRQLDLSELHSVIYTSGTTGRPKGAMLTYGNHWWSATGSMLNLGMSREDHWLAVLPLFHVGGLAILLRGAIYGNAVTVHERFEPARVNAAIDEEGVTVVSLVSTMLTRMLDERGDERYPPSLRAVLLGGGPAPLSLLERCAALGVPVLQTYGMTETASQAVTLAPEDALRKLGSAGKPLLPVELRVDAAQGEVGEIIVRGPNVSPGYYHRPDATERAFHDGWFHTGDIGRLDEEGYLYVLDRRDDLIVSGGENVYPAEVEAALLAHPAVADVGVMGIPDEQWGQRVAATVVLREGAEVTDDELRSFLRRTLAGYKVPSEVRFASSLPRNAAGKLLRRELRHPA